MPRTAIALLALALVIGVPAQDPPANATLAGTVLQKNGSPWAGATVHLLWRPVRARPDVGAGERTEAVSDPRGRFRFSVFRGRRYTLWARQEAGEGSYRTTGALPAVASTDAPRLRELAVQYRRGMLVEGLAPWRERGPFRYRVLSRTGHPVLREGPLDPEQPLVLPALPGPDAHLCVLSADGLLIGWNRIALTDPRGGQVRVAPPRQVRVWVREEGGGAAARAQVVQSTPWGVEVVATLGDDGRGAVELPLEGDRLPSYGRWLARGPGLGMGLLEVDRSPRNEEDAAFTAAGGAVLGTILFPEKVIEGRLLLRPGTPAARVPVVVDGTTKARFPNGGLNAHDVVRVAVTGADGSFRIGGLSVDEKTVVRAVLTAEVIEHLPAPYRGMPAEVLLALDVTAERARLGDLVLTRDVCALTILWELPDGRPASGVEVALLDTSTLGGPVIRVPGDRLGRTSFWMPRGATFDVAAGHPEGVFAGRFTVTSPGETLPRAVWPVRLSAGLLIRGQAVHKKEPVAGARVYALVAISPQPVLLDLPGPERTVGGVHIAPDELIGWQARTAAYVIATQLTRCQSDGNGYFITRVPRIAGMIEVIGDKRTDQGQLQGRRRAGVGPEDAELELDIEFKLRWR